MPNLMHHPPFAGVDIGGPRRAGETRLTPADVEIVAGGVDIWGTQDEFHFACLRVAGDFELSARLVSLGMADLYTKAGLMMRTSLAPGAEHAFLLAFGDNQPRNNNNGGIEFQYRLEAGSPCRGIYPPQPLTPEPEFPATYPDLWLKLVREADTISGFYRNTRAGEKLFSWHVQQFPHDVYLGLAVTAHHADQAVRAVFSQVQLRANLIASGADHPL